jgi:multiple sugar transport system substrate-binding protein
MHHKEKEHRSMKPFRPIVLVSATAILLSGCAASGDVPQDLASCDGEIDDAPATVSVWNHSGDDVQRQTLQAQVDAFNDSQSDVVVELNLLPEGNYNDQVKAAAATGDLPDLLDLDGPYMHNYAWSGDLVPIDDCTDEELTSDLFPGVTDQGTYQGDLYGLSQTEAGLGLASRRSVLEDLGIRIPDGPDDAWTGEELTDILAELRDAGYEHPINLRWNNPADEWYTYAYSTIVWSAGGDLIDRSDYQSADGVLNSPEVVEALTLFQSWFTDDLVDSNEDDAAFQSGRSIITWSGQNNYKSFSEAFGDDLILLPLPDWGQGSKTGHGNWQWAVTKNAADPDAAYAFLEYLLSPEELTRWSEATAGIAVRESVAAESPLYGDGAPLEIYRQQLLDDIAVSRPQTPAYPVITSQFARALRLIADGADVKSSLDDAVKAIDLDIEDNNGYTSR